MYLLFLLVQVLLQHRYGIDVGKYLLDELGCRDLKTFSFEAVALHRVGSALLLSHQAFLSKDLAEAEEEALHRLSSLGCVAY